MQKQRILIIFFVNSFFVSSFIRVFNTTEVQGAELIIADSFNTTGGSWGSTWDGQYLWVSDIARTRIFKLTPSNGEIVYSFKSPGSRPKGLAWDGQYLWNIDSVDKKIYKINPVDGKLLQSLDAPEHGIGGLTWDGQYLWLADP